MTEVHVPLETVIVEGKSYQVTSKTAAMIRAAVRCMEESEKQKNQVTQVTLTIERGEV